jgi:hypothetical protein
MFFCCLFQFYFFSQIGVISRVMVGQNTGQQQEGQERWSDEVYNLKIMGWNGLVTI